MIQVKYVLFPKLSAICAPEPKNKVSECSPKAEYKARVESWNDIYCQVSLQWGELGESDVFFDIECFASANIEEKDFSTPRDCHDVERLFDYSRNAAQIMIGSIREQVAAMSARTPMGCRTLPSMHVPRSSDFVLEVTEEMQGQLDVAALNITSSASPSNSGVEESGQRKRG